MVFENTAEFALKLDERDSLKYIKQKFLIPQHNKQDSIYLCGNSLGLQPRLVREAIGEQLSNWENLGVEGWFKGNEPWLSYHQKLAAPLSALVGAELDEITVMNSLTVNLHLLLISYYKPTNKRFKILMEGGAFPSDQYAIESQVLLHDCDPAKAIIEIFPREGEYSLRTEDIVAQIEKHGDEVALVLFGGVNYYTGQFFDLEAISIAAHRAGAFVGFDLAHAIGNVPLQLHNWGVDFACWCSYKYLNSGPGGVSGIFVHQRHFDDKGLKRLAGWWGYRQDKRFLMTPGFQAAHGADGWQVSTSSILLLSVHKTALEVLNEAGGIIPLREKSIALTAFLEFIINQINNDLREEVFKIITPQDRDSRGCQLSLLCKKNGRNIFSYLEENGVIGDWREPNVIRLSPVPLYNSFTDVFHCGLYLLEAALQNGL